MWGDGVRKGKEKGGGGSMWCVERDGSVWRGGGTEKLGVALGDFALPADNDHQLISGCSRPSGGRSGCV